MTQIQILSHRCRMGMFGIQSSEKVLNCSSLDDWATKCWPWILMQTFVCIDVCVYIYIYTHTHIYVYVSWVHVYMYMYIHTYIHTYDFKRIITCTYYIGKTNSVHVQNRWSLGICCLCILGNRSSQRGKALRIPCGHLFHEDCVKELLMEFYFLCFSL